MSRDEDFDDSDSKSSFNLDLTLEEAEDNYYAFLNVSREASHEDIQYQYRKLSKILHPDKHTDPEKKKEAEELFNKVKKAYETLIDDNKRAIYDSVGIPGLDPERMQVLLKYKNASEIREEFEKLTREREERLLEQKTNPKGSLIVNLNATEIFSPYIQNNDEEDEYYIDETPYVEFTGIHISQSIETPLTSKNTLLLSGNVSSENGRGSGAINFGLRHLLGGSSSCQVDLGASTNGLQFGLRGFTQIGKRYFLNVSAGGSSKAYRPNFLASIGCQLDEKTLLSLAYRHGGLTGLESSLVREFTNNRLEASLMIGHPHSYGRLTLSHRFEEAEIRATVKGGTFGGYFEYGIDKKISKITTFGAVMSVGLPSGVSLRVKVKRGNQIYIMPIQLADEIIPTSIVYGTLAPLLAYAVIKKFLLDPYEEEKKSREKEKTKQSYRAKMEKKKSEAEGTIKLMEETYARVIQDEENKKGLILIRAVFGHLLSLEEAQNHNSDELIDVTVPLQCLVRDSKLEIHEENKTQLPGFFDPAPGEEKNLLIRYKFRNKIHETMFKEEEKVKIPNKTHLIANIESPPSTDDIKSED